MGSGASKKGQSSLNLQTRDKKCLIKTLSGHTGGINCMDVAENLLLTGSDDRTARLWDLITFDCMVVLEGHGGYISCCKMWQGHFALTGSFDKTIRKWNTTSGNCVLKLEQHRGVINKMLVYMDFLFSASYDSTSVCWDLRTGEAVRIFRGHSKSILPLAYVEGSDHDPGGGTDIERNNDLLLTGSMDKTARLWNINTGESVRTFRGHKEAVISTAVDVDNMMLFTGSTDCTIRKWNILTGGPLKVFKGHEGSVLCLQMHHRLLYSASADATARCWVAEFGDTTRKYVGHDHMISDMIYHQGIVFTGSGDSIVRAFDSKSGTLKRTYKGHKFPINCLVPWNYTIMSSSYDGTVKMWNIHDLLKEKLDGSCSTIGSSVSHKGRQMSESYSDSDSAVKSNLSGSRRKPKKQPTVDITHELPLNEAKLRRAKKFHSGKVAPSSRRMNGNNNNSNNRSEIDCGYITNKLQNNILESGSSSVMSSALSESNRQYKVNGSLTPSTDLSSRDTFSGKSGMSADSSRPQTNLSNRSGMSVLMKGGSYDVLTKRPRTESSVISGTSSTGINADIALVDEEIRMVAMETSSNTSGYRTADNNTPSPQQNDKTLEKVKSRQKPTVTFSPKVSSLKENREWNFASSRSSKIPIKTNGIRKPSASGSERSFKSTSTPGSPLTDQKRKILEQEILDMV